MITERRFYKSVGATTTLVDEYVPANGLEISIQEIGGNAIQEPSVSVRIIWDYGTANAAPIFSTNGDSVQQPKALRLVGDGVKKLAIVLDNGKLSAQYLGGYWVANHT